MGLLDSFMPGETAGIPDQATKRGLLDDPWMQLGLGILANSQGNSFGTALGKGGLQAFGNLQQQQQLGYQKQLRDLQMKEAQQKLSQATAMQKAKEAFKLAHPEYADAVDLDPTLAIKAAYPQIAHNGADPYYTPIPTDQGLGSFDNRSGKFTIVQGANGQPIVKSTDSPLVRGNVASAESQAKASWKPNTDVNGVVSTDAQIAQAANPNLNAVPLGGFNTPYPMKWSGAAGIGGAPGTTATDKAEGITADNLNLRNPANPNKIGIAVPTKAQNDRASQDQKNESDLNYKPKIAGSEADAKNTSDLTFKPKINAADKSAVMEAENKTQAKIDLPKAIADAQNTSRQIDELIGSVDGKTKPHKGFGTAVGLSSKLDPRNYIAGTDATDFNNRVAQIKGGQFLQAFSNLKGGGSITEIEGKKATDAIARMNTASSEGEFIKAAREYQSIINANVARAKLKSGMTNKDVKQATTQATPQVRTVDW